jgi:hypothetical protein
MKLRTKVGAVAAAGILGGALFMVNAQASVPSSNGFDVNTSSFSINFPSSPGVLSSRSVECDGNTDTVVGGGVILDNATEGSPPRGLSSDIVSSAPQVGGQGFKDSWHVLVKGTNSSYDYDYTAYVVCKTGS